MQLEELEEPLQLFEINVAIQQIARSRAPGRDGLPIEYYATYNEALATKLLEMYNEAWESGSLPPSLSEAVIVVLHKPGRDPQDVKSYRPLSLLNTDYKILSKVLANRLRRIIGDLIHPDHNGFIPTRNTFLNTRRLLHIMQGVPRWGEALATVALDIEKAFDTLGWQYLHAVMAAMQFGPHYVRWIYTLYKNPRARVRL